MTLFKNRYRIESIRYKGWDYSNNRFYFVTICTKNRNCCLGEIISNKFVQNDLSVMLNEIIVRLPTHYSNCFVDEYIIMPNHVHMILKLYFKVETGLKPVSTGKQYSLCEIIRGLKTFSARGINEKQNIIGHNFWQRGYYDRIIRNVKEYWTIKKYIQDNPKNWLKDRNYI